MCAARCGPGSVRLGPTGRSKGGRRQLPSPSANAVLPWTQPGAKPTSASAARAAPSAPAPSRQQDSSAAAAQPFHTDPAPAPAQAQRSRGCTSSTACGTSPCAASEARSAAPAYTTRGNEDARSNSRASPAPSSEATQSCTRCRAAGARCVRRCHAASRLIISVVTV